MTQKKLSVQRRKADMPHHSFDLDGDGHISMTDLFLAKRFDADKDGRLSTEELATAKTALSKGYKDQFLFGLDRSGIVQSSLLVRDKEDAYSTEQKNKPMMHKGERILPLRVM